MMSAAPPLAHAGVGSIEAELLKLVNGKRLINKLMPHAGLLTQARQHSKNMGAAGAMNHDGAAGRFENAGADPHEANGAPDDGFTPVWCENVAWVGGGPAEDVAQLIYNGWFNSPRHLLCMMNPATTVAGLGIAEVDGEWWATLDAQQDTTMPSGQSPAKTPAPARTPVVAKPTAQPAAAARPKSTPTAQPTKPPVVEVAAKSHQKEPATQPLVHGLPANLAAEPHLRPLQSRASESDRLTLAATLALLTAIVLVWVDSRQRRRRQTDRVIALT
jgi:hypothetical protein